MERYAPVSFRKLIPPLESSYVEYEVPVAGTLEEIEMVFAQNQQMLLQVYPVIIEAGSQLPTPIILSAPGTNNYISGDNVTIKRRSIRELTPGDRIRINYINTDAANSLNLVVDVAVDYYAGKRRVI